MRAKEAARGIVVMGGTVTGAEVLIPLLVLDLVGWATTTAQSFRSESEDEDWTATERQRFLDRATRLEEWVASAAPKREIPQDLNLFLSLRSSMQPFTVEAGELPRYIQAVLQVSTQLPVEKVEEPQFVLKVDSGEFWVSDEPSMHSIRSHAGPTVKVTPSTSVELNALIANLGID